jgi:predicted ribosomally synthesized peptide with nif11-like leader
MSQEKLKAFAEAVSKSEELQKRFDLIQMEAVRSTAEKLAKLSESAGTPFTAEEYLQAMADSSEEMSAEQLSRVAGGGEGPRDATQWAIISAFSFGLACLGFAIGSFANPNPDPTSPQPCK